MLPSHSFSIQSESLQCNNEQKLGLLRRQYDDKNKKFGGRQRIKTTRFVATEDNELRDGYRSNSILDDGDGNISRELAEMMWNWEQRHRLDAHLPKMPYSSRSGLRLVKEVVDEVIKNNRLPLSSSSSSTITSSSNIESDLIQEGMIALMDVMNEYRKKEEKQLHINPDPDDISDDPKSSQKGQENKQDQQNFEAVARKYITKLVTRSLKQDYSTPEPISNESQKRLEQIEKLKAEARKDEIELSTQEIATKLGISHDTLLDLLVDQLEKQNKVLSVESTIEIINPNLGNGDSVSFQDQEEWEYNDGQNLLYDSSKNDVIDKDLELVDEYIDENEMLKYEGDDNMWEHHEQIVGPLKDLIPDNEQPTPDDLALLDMIKFDVTQFLNTTLNTQENQIVRMRFGLDSGKPISQTNIGKSLGISPIQTHHILIEALDKLRLSYENRYVETYLEEDNYDDELFFTSFPEDTV